MRVAQVLPHRRLGGMQQVAYYLDGVFADAGLDPVLVALKPEDPAAPAPGPVRSVLGLRSRLRRERVDVCFSHAPRAALVAAAAGVLAGVPRRVTVVHEDASGLGALDRRLLHLLCRVGWVTDVVFVGESVRASFAGSPRALLRRGRVIRNGATLAPAATTPLTAGPRPDGPTVVLSVGRLVEPKNLDVLVRACAGLAPDDVVLRVVGSGPDEERLTRLAAEVRAPLELTGRLTPEDVAVEHARSTVFAMPSRSEGLPLVLLDAAAAGRPVVASDIPANREVMGSAALYCPADDVAAWRSAIDRVRHEPGLRATLGAASRDRAAAFDPRGMADGYLDLVRSTGGRAS